MPARSQSRPVALALLASLVLLWTPPTRALEVTYGGRLVDASGVPLAGPLDVEVRFFRSASGADQVGPTLTFAAVPVTDGVFQTPLALSAAETQAVLGDGAEAAWIQVTAAGVDHPRQRIGAVPVALRVPVDGATIGYDADGKLAVTSVPGLATKADAADLTALGATVAGKAAATHTHAQADVSGLAAALAAKSDTMHGHTLAGDVTGAVGATTVGKLQGRSVTTDTPSSGQVLKWNGSAWAPAADVSGTSGAGESTSATNLGASGAGLYKTLNGHELQFRKIVAGSGVSVTENADDVTIATSVTQYDDAAAKAAAVADQIADAVTDVAPSQNAVHDALAGKAASSHAHSGADVTSGTIADARLSANVTLLGGAIDYAELPATGCSDGQVLKRVAGAWACAADTDTDTNAGGDVTGVSAGAGLTGGGASGAVTLSVDAGTAANQIVQLDAGAKLPAVDGSALTSLNATQLTTGTVPDARLSASVSLLGSAIDLASEVTGTLPDANLSAAVTKLGSAIDLASEVSGTLPDANLSAAVTKLGSAIDYAELPATGCSDGQVLKRVAGAWACAADTDTDTNAGGDVTGVTAGTGLTGGGATGALTLSVDVGTTAGKIVQLDGSGYLPALDGRNLTNLDATDLTGTIAAARLPTGIDAANLGGGAVSSTELSYLDGVTSAIQTQLNAKAATTHTHSSLDASDGAPTQALYVDAAGEVGIGTTTPNAPLEVAGEIRGARTSNFWSAQRTGYVGKTGAWTTVPGLSQTFTLTRAAKLQLVFSGELRTLQDAGYCHVGVRFSVNGVGRGNASWGERLVMGYGGNNWWTSFTLNSSVSLAAGTHTITADANSSGTSGVCNVCGENDGSMPGYTACELQIVAFYD